MLEYTVPQPSPEIAALRYWVFSVKGMDSVKVAEVAPGTSVHVPKVAEFLCHW